MYCHFCFLQIRKDEYVTQISFSVSYKWRPGQLQSPNAKCLWLACSPQQGLLKGTQLPGHMHITPLEKGKGRETNLPPHSAPLEARWSSRQLLCPGLLQNYCALELLQPPIKCPHLPLLGQSWCQTYHNELQLEVHLGRKENVYLYLTCGVKNTSETKSPLNASCLQLIFLADLKSCILYIQYFVHDVKVEKITQVYKDEGHNWEGGKGVSL